MTEQNKTFTGPVRDLPPDNLPAEITHNQARHLQTITKGNLAEMVANAEALVEFNKKITELAIKQTEMSDWVMLGDFPYLMDRGIDKVLQLVGASIVDISITEEKLTTADGTQSIHYTATGTILFNGRSASNIGMSSTKDAFFADRSRWIPDPDKPGENKKEKYKLPLEEIEIPNIKKKCVTNLKHRLLNMAVRVSPSKEALEAAFGEKFKGSSVSYGKGSKGGSISTGKEGDHRTELGNLVRQIAHYENSNEKDTLMALTAYNDFKGWYTLDRVSPKALPIALDKARKKAGTLGIDLGAPPAAGQNNQQPSGPAPTGPEEDLPLNQNGQGNGGGGFNG